MRGSAAHVRSRRRLVVRYRQGYVAWMIRTNGMTRTQRTFVPNLWLGGFALCVFLIACGTGPSTTTPSAPAMAVVPVASPSATTTKEPPAAARPIVVTTQAVPAAVKIDGDLSEWKLPATAAQVAPWVVVTVAQDKVYLVAALKAEQRLVVTLADSLEFGSFIPPLLAWEHSSDTSTQHLAEEQCQHEQVEDYSTGPGWIRGEPHPKEIVDACLGLLRHHEKTLNDYGKQFVRHFGVSQDGVKVLDGDTTLRPTSAAKRMTWGPARARVTIVEASLPLAALPQLYHAPLEALQVSAVESASDGPFAEEDHHWSVLALSSPIEWTTQAALRAFYFEEGNWSASSFERHFSYHPSKPKQLSVLARHFAYPVDVDKKTKLALHIQYPSLKQDSTALEVKPLGSHNGIAFTTVGDGTDTHLLALKDGQLRGHFNMIHMIMKHALTRKGQRHFFLFDAGQHSWHAQGGYDRAARWVV